VSPHPRTDLQRRMAGPHHTVRGAIHLTLRTVLARTRARVQGAALRENGLSQERLKTMQSGDEDHSEEWPGKFGSSAPVESMV
jgi:hypothetical protein